MELIKAKDYRKNETIKGCPFCGSSSDCVFLERYSTVAGERWRIVCASCMAQIDRGYDQTPGILIDLWNKRS